MNNILWAKLSPDDVGSSRKWLSLIDHSADVSAVFAAMLSVPLVVRRLEQLANSEGWPEPWTERLAAHVALHDFGKANRGFQARRDPAKPLIGHVGPGLALLYSDGQLAEHLCKVLPFEAMASWGSSETFEIAVRAVAAHHGRPLSRSAIENQWSNQLRTLWAPGTDADPIAALKPLGDAVRQWFPAAFAPRRPAAAVGPALLARGRGPCDAGRLDRLGHPLVPAGADERPHGMGA